MERTHRLLTELIDAAKARNELNRSVDTRTLVFNLFSLYFNFQYLWLATDMPPREQLTRRFEKDSRCNSGS